MLTLFASQVLKPEPGTQQMLAEKLLEHVFRLKYGWSLTHRCPQDYKPHEGRRRAAPEDSIQHGA